jgi:hypothetical protein
LAQTQYEAAQIVPPPQQEPPEDEGIVDLPLIMPDDVVQTRPRRADAEQPAAFETAPFRRATLADDDGAADRGTLARAEPVVTETMAELYLRQGHREDALRVYRALLAQRPDDAALQRKIATLSGGGLRAGSGQSAGDFLRGILRGGTGAAPGVADDVATPDQQAGTTLDQAFEAMLGDDAPGEPSRPADDAISLDSVFGDSGGSRPQAAAGARAPGAGAPAAGADGGAGFSFDEFFSAPGGAARPEGRDAEPAPRPSGAPPGPAMDDEGDLDQFQDWLKKLKS